MPPVPIGHSWVDESGAPLYRLAFPPRTTDEELHAYYDKVDRWAASLTEPVAWVVDVAGVVSATPAQRKIVSEREARLSAIQKRLYRGSAFVAKSTLTRGLVTAVFWMTPPPYPYKVFDDERAARAWAAGQLGARQ